MKTFKFVAAIVILISVLIAIYVVLTAQHIFRKKGEDANPKANKIRIIGIVYIFVAIAVVIILMKI